MEQQPESAIIESMIAQSRQQIAQAEREMLALQRQVTGNRAGVAGWVDTREHPLMIQALQEQISNLEQGIKNLEHRLPTVLMNERIAATINANNARAQAEREAQAAAERDVNMRQAAQQRYMASGGDPAQFEVIWPAIRQQIALSEATGAATVALAQPTGIDQARLAVQSVLATRYAGYQQGGE